MKIEYIDFGIGFRNNGIIYLNKKLLEPKWKELYDYTISHEAKHTDKTISIKDILIDFNLNPKVLSFLIENPKELFYMFSPVFKLNSKLMFNPVMILEWMIFIAVIIGGVLLI